MDKRTLNATLGILAREARRKSRQSLVDVGRKIGCNKQNVSQELYLVDETDDYFILAFEAMPTETQNTSTLKIDRSLAKAILFVSDHKKKS